MTVHFPRPVLANGTAVVLCGGALLGALAAGMAGCRTASGCRDGAMPASPVTNPGNAAFYAADGAFQGAAAKEAYFAMMRAFDYPIPAVLGTDEFWVCDFLQRDFETLGMGGIFWINANGAYGQAGSKAYAGAFKDGTYGYLGHEIYLLPGQMLPEHRHVGGHGGFGPKMESWHVRYGTVEFFGEHRGAGDETLIADMPEEQRPFGFGEPWFRARYVARRTAGQIYSLEDPESWHFQRAGANGAIVSEYATYHNHVEFSKPGMEFSCSEARR
ncbi:MAG: hypothetical protein JXR77_05840 [Lentisphaeria bacterium]|nr:hypothetical protein [Lentisphaeria bacterium]